MYSGGVFPGSLILSSPSRIIPRGFNAFLARDYFFLGFSIPSSPETTFSSGLPRKSCKCLKSLARSREVPTVLRWTLSRPLSDRTNETWYKKMLTKLILTTLRVVINTPHPEPELIDVLPFKCNHKFSDNKCNHKSSKDKCNHQSRSEGSGNLLEAS